MKSRILYIPIFLLLLLSFVDCAKKGTPTGGPRDTIPPIIVRSIPENYTTNFKGDEIQIRFDEYIKLKDLDKHLIISPPMKYRPVITPFNTSKTLKIKIIDTLKPNTTYSFNFGKSIQDNNEGNAFEYFKYVFSTGDYIDSLQVTGKVRDAQLISPEVPITVVLYEANESFSDSLILSEKPTYVTVTKDTTGYFELNNLKEGKYLLLALKDKDNDYIYQPKSDKIGFASDIITVPTDSTYSLILFKEKPLYKLARPSQVGKNHIIFGYEGEGQDVRVENISVLADDFESEIYKEKTQDTLHYWYKPAITSDSLVFRISNQNVVDTITVKMRERFADTLKITATRTGIMKRIDTLEIRANIPIMNVDNDKIEVISRDSTLIYPNISLNRKYNITSIYFPKEPAERYLVRIFPGALTDFLGKTNDTLRFEIRTKDVSDYGTLRVTINNIRSFPVILQLVDTKYKVVEERHIKTSKEGNSIQVFFDEVSPAKYFLRMVFDNNANGKWDSGSFFERRLPEPLIYYPKQIEVRPNWSLNETFILK